MTAQQLIDFAASRPLPIACLLAGEIVLALLLGLFSGRRSGEVPWKYGYTVLVYVACAGGVVAALLTGYSLLFLHANLLAVNALVYFAPIVAMALTLWLIRRHVAFDLIPGFDRLSGLIVLIAVTFAIVFVLSRLFVGVVFLGSVWVLLAFAAFLFALLKWGARTAFRERGAPRPERPTFGG